MVSRGDTGRRMPSGDRTPPLPVRRQRRTHAAPATHGMDPASP